MAATEKGVWDVQDVRDKQLQSEWDYTTLDNELWAWGSGEKGYTAQNSKVQYSSPLQIPGGWLRTKPYHDASVMAAIKSDSTLWVWGSNYEGALGLNCSYTGGSCPVNSKSSPTQIPSVGGFNTWNVVASGASQVVAIKSDNTLHGWGRNHTGGLGLNSEGTAGRRSRPTQIGTDNNWSDVTAGDAAYMAIKTDGTLWTWGENENPNGVLGLNDINDRSSPTQVPGSWASMTKGFRYANAAIKTDGTLWMWGGNNDGMMGQNSPEPSKRSSPVQIPGSWSKVDVGDAQAAGIKTDGTLWTWGKNEYGNLGHNNPLSAHKSSPTQVPGTNWADVAMSGVYTLASKTDGTLWSWGYNNQGGLGQNQPQLTIVKSPVQVGAVTPWTSVHISGENNTSYAILQQ